MLKGLKVGLLLLGSALFTTGAFAQDDNVSGLTKEIITARNARVEFKPYQLFDKVAAGKHEELINATTLKPKASAVSDLYAQHPRAVAVRVTNEEGTTYTLNMLRSNPLSANGNTNYIDNNGTHALNADKGVHYQGAVDGYGKSIATMSIFANGDVAMLFANKDGNYVVGKLKDESGNYVLYNDKNLTAKQNTICGTVDEMPGTVEIETGNEKTTSNVQCNKISLYWETDYSLYLYNMSKASMVQSYAISLFNNVQALYRNEGIAVELKSLNIWTTADGYTEDGTSIGALNDFRTKWNMKGDNFDGDLAMLLALDPGGLGGVAYLGQLCNRSYAYAYGDVSSYVGNIPVYSWDVSMVTHEIGHNIASPHTHWCGWNTGAGGACGAIDDCYNQEYGSGCSSCSSTYTNAQPVNAWSGSIMSYCHLVSRGVDLANGFGPLPAALMRNTINNRFCLKSVISAELLATDICNMQGTIKVQFDTTRIGESNLGNNPYNFAWSNSASTKDIIISQPGTYSVTVTDANGCSNTFTANVTASTMDSCGNATSVAPVAQQQYVSIYPNPANNNVMMKFFANSTSDMNIRLTDVMGRVVKQTKVHASSGENNVTINVTDIPSGMYYIQLSSNTEQFAGVKLVVQ